MLHTVSCVAATRLPHGRLAKQRQPQWTGSKKDPRRGRRAACVALEVAKISAVVIKTSRRNRQIRPKIAKIFFAGLPPRTPAGALPQTPLGLAPQTPKSATLTVTIIPVSPGGGVAAPGFHTFHSRR